MGVVYGPKIAPDGARHVPDVEKFVGEVGL